jgi:hypothetical protein
MSGNENGISEIGANGDQAVAPTKPKATVTRKPPSRAGGTGARTAGAGTKRTGSKTPAASAKDPFQSAGRVWPD